MKAGVYFIPARGPFYELGSKVLGYDIRGAYLVKRLSLISSASVNGAVGYGFHLTITDVVDVTHDQLDEFSRFLQSVPGFFSKKTVFELTWVGVDFMPDNNRQLAIKYEASESVNLLQTLLVCLVQMRGKGSSFTKKLKEDPEGHFHKDPSKRFKIEVFLSPYCLGDYLPHFTLINPLPKGLIERKKMKKELSVMFEQYKNLEINSLCLVVGGKDGFFKIYTEIPLKGHG